MRDRSGKFELVVRPKNRTPADEYPHQGRTWIEGRDNSSFVVEVTNHGHLRARAVVSVDGVSVLDGKPASFDGQGYVVNPGQTISIPGWATSASSAAEFFFTRKSEGYAEQTGQGGNAGVIGAAFFEERPPVATRRVTPGGKPWSPMTKGIVASASLSTGFGDSVDWNTTQTTFDQAHSTPSATLVLNYDSASNLQKMGIRLRERNVATATSQAFPGNSAGYCEPPPSWVTKNTR